MVLFWMGLGLQIVGTVAAIGAAVSEWRRDRHLDVDAVQVPTEERVNPWSLGASAKVRHEASRAGSHWRYHSRPDDPQMDPELAETVAYNDAWLDEKSDQLYEDWEEQARQDVALRRALVAMVNEQVRLLRDDQTATRKRVSYELGGLVLVAVGTVLSSLPQ